MTRITKNPYALIADENDPLGRVDVVTLVGEEVFARYDRGGTFELDPRLVISRDDTPERLLAIRDALRKAWAGAGEAVQSTRGELGQQLTEIDTDGRYNVEGIVDRFSAHWIEQRQDLWRQIIGRMRLQPVLAPA